MARMTLHEARQVVALDAAQAGIDPDRLDWLFPGETAMTCLSYAATAGIVVGAAAHRIGRAFLAYQAHLDFEAGKAFADTAAARHLEAEGTRSRHNAAALGYPTAVGDALVARAADIREGLHYAEPEET